MDVSNKVVMISGASSGIGRSLARILSNRKAKVVLLARREERLRELEVEIKAANHEALAIKTDITDREQVSKAVKSTLEKFGKIDIVINNAGVGYFGTVEKLAIEEFDRLIQTNVYGMVHLSQLSIPALKKTRGMIVNISSGLSKRALPFLAAYASTKSMVDALSDGMRLELRKYGVKVLTYCPPETETEIFEVTTNEKGLEARPTSHRKKAKVEDVAARIVAAIEADKREVVEGKFLQVMNLFAPKLLDNMFYKGMVEKIMRD